MNTTEIGKFFDRHGCSRAYISGKYLRAQIIISLREIHILDEIEASLGYGKIGWNQNNEIWRYRISKTSEVLSVLELLLPELTNNKRERAQIVINLIREKANLKWNLLEERKRHSLINQTGNLRRGYRVKNDNKLRQNG